MVIVYQALMPLKKNMNPFLPTLCSVALYLDKFSLSHSLSSLSLSLSLFINSYVNNDQEVLEWVKRASGCMIIFGKSFARHKFLPDQLKKNIVTSLANVQKLLTKLNESHDFSW